MNIERINKTNYMNLLCSNMGSCGDSQALHMSKLVPKFTSKGNKDKDFKYILSELMKKPLT